MKKLLMILSIFLIVGCSSASKEEEPTPTPEVTATAEVSYEEPTTVEVDADSEMTCSYDTEDQLITTTALSKEGQILQFIEESTKKSEGNTTEIVINNEDYIDYGDKVEVMQGMSMTPAGASMTNTMTLLEGYNPEEEENPLPTTVDQFQQEMETAGYTCK